MFSAPSGSGKTTLVHYLLSQSLPLGFSISATSRTPRSNEQNGVDYHFMSPEQFQAKIKADEFLEYDDLKINGHGGGNYLTPLKDILLNHDNYFQHFYQFNQIRFFKYYVDL